MKWEIGEHYLLCLLYVEEKLLAASWCKFKYMGGVCKVGWDKMW